MSLPHNRFPLLIFLPCARIPFSVGDSPFLLWHLHLWPPIGERTELQGSAQGQCFHLALFVARFRGERWENCPVWAFCTCHLLSAVTKEVGVGRWFSSAMQTDRVFWIGGQEIISPRIFFDYLMQINVFCSNTFPVNILYDRYYRWEMSVMNVPLPQMWQHINW